MYEKITELLKDENPISREKFVSIVNNLALEVGKNYVHEHNQYFEFDIRRRKEIFEEKFSEIVIWISSTFAIHFVFFVVSILISSPAPLIVLISFLILAIVPSIIIYRRKSYNPTKFRINKQGTVYITKNKNSEEVLDLGTFILQNPEINLGLFFKTIIRSSESESDILQERLNTLSIL